MSLGVSEYINGGITYTENQAFRPVVLLDSDGIRLTEEIVPFINLETEIKLSTTDATPTQITSFAIPDYTTMLVEAKVVARRTGGSAGTDEDGLAYVLKAAFKNVAGTATQIGATETIIAAKDNAAWGVAFDVNSDDIIIEVTGDTDNDIDWICYVTKHFITTIIDVIPP